MASKLKKITYSIVVLLLILTCSSVCYSQQVSRLVNYHADFKPFGEGIKKEYPFPKDVDPDNHFQIVFTFQVMPEQIEADVMGTIIFDQENGTIQIRGNDGSLQSKGGLELKGVVKIAFEIESIPILCDGPLLFTVLCPVTFTINQFVEFPLSIKGEATFLEPGDLNLSQLLPIGSLTIKPYQTWKESEPFSTLLLNDDVAVRGGIRDLVQAELSAVDVVQLIIAALTAIPPSVSEPLGTIIESGLVGNAKIRANLGFLSTATLSGKSITVNGVKITRENQTIKAPGLDLSQDSYTVNSSYNEKFTYKLDLTVTSDIVLEFNPLGIPIWDYKKEIGELPIPIVSEQEVDLNFTPNQITFPIAQTSTVPTVQPPVPKDVIPAQYLTDGGSSETVNLTRYFSSENNLSYEVSVTDRSIARASVSGSRVTIRPRSAGGTTVVVTARDTVNTNLTAIQTIYVVVQQTNTSIVHPPNNDPPFGDLPNPRAKGFDEGVSIIIQNVPLGGLPLNLRSNPWMGNNDIGDLWDGATGIITDGPEENDGFTWWKIDWDQVDIEAWSVEAFGGDQLLFRRPPDLEILNLYVSDSKVSIGEEIELEVEIKNNGPGKSAETEVYFYYHSLDSPNYDLERLGKAAEDGDLRGGWTRPVPSLREDWWNRDTMLRFTVDAPTTPGTYYYGAFLPANFDSNEDYVGDLPEDVGENNFAEVEVRVTGSPDYIVESIRVNKTTVDPGETFRLSATVRNVGLGEPTKWATLKYYRSSDARISNRDTNPLQLV